MARTKCSMRGVAGAIAFAVLAAGCAGSDGAQGPQGVAGEGTKGDPGNAGTAGPAGPIGPPNYNPYTADEAVATVTTPAAVSGSNVVVSFNVKVGGVNRNDFIEKASAPGGVVGHNEDAWWFYDTTAQAGSRTKIDPTTWTLASKGSGNYTATISGLPAAALANGTAFMLSTRGSNSETATVVSFLGPRTHDTVGDEACVACHGAHIWRGAAHDVTNPYGVGPCVICHNRTGSADPRLPGAGTGLMGIAHGIHNSTNMAAGMNVDIDPSPATTVKNANAAGHFVWTWASNGNKFDFSFGFPTYMQNCTVCHNTPARLAAVMAKSQVSWALCMSCHNDWNGFPNTGTTGSRAGHRSYTIATNCGQCHTGNIATIAYFHDGLTTDRDGVVVGGEDLSVKLGRNFRIVVKSVAVDTTSTAVVWSVIDPTNATTYAPCNQSFTTGPVFFGWVGAGGEHSCTGTASGCSSNFSVLRAYAQGDDWVANLSTTRPAQPNSVNVTTSNTTCVGFDATTVVSNEVTAATRAQLSIQGRAQLDADPSAATTILVWARSESPVYQYDPATGAALADRRQIVSNAKCLACHPGSLYQHGGTRIDSVELCIMCHNPASNDQNNRAAMGVDASEAYDGKKGQTYDLRTMIHAIHSAGESTVPLVIYRSSGVYAFGNADAIAALPHWPGAGTATVYGSASSLPHNEILVHYPRRVSTCLACHVGGSDFIVDPAKAVAVTDEDAGAQSADPAIGWMDQADDVLVGPTTAACLSCHLGSNGKTKVEQMQLKAHAQQFSWPWTALGRSTLLDGSPIETCFVCHDAKKHQ